MTMLHEKFTNYKDMAGQDAFSNLVPQYIIDNLNPNFAIRPYQEEAFGRFEYYFDTYPNKPKNQPLNVLYHMATGSGKTLIMAGEILTLYKRGYRNFLFFVNSTNIIKKTKENFLNKASTKYLFKDEINIDGELINVREVDNFASANPDDINIVFTTIQGLHSVMSHPKENALSLEDFEDNKIVLISDEAHHINAETKKKKTNDELLSVVSWENTIKDIFNSNTENIMLEYTATADLTAPEIKDKYQDVLLFDYPLKQFRQDLYSKEVKVLQADSEPLDRALQAVILSQYRRKVFEKNKLIIKPVILFKSKIIKDSQSFHKEFIQAIEGLDETVLDKIKNLSVNGSVLRKAFDFFQTNNKSLETLALELKEDFSIEKTLEVNSKDHVESQQLLLNSLEDQSNEIRAIFAVDKLNEGWDVLNLFDIVRLYDTRDSKANKVGKTTLQEAQLIGRGARYCPFKVDDEQPLYQRKYDTFNDNEEEHELKICEELYYHSAHNPKYIQELNQALQELGIKAKTSRELSLKLKDDFKKTNFYNNGFLYVNKRLPYDREDVVGLDSSLINTDYSYSVKTGTSSTLTVFEQSSIQNIDVKRRVFKISDFGSHIIRKALASNPAFKFRELVYLFPKLKSLDEFITSTSYLGNIKVSISGREDVLDYLPQIEKLNAVKKVIAQISEKLKQDRIDFKGSTEFKAEFIRRLYENDKVLNIVNDGLTDQEFGLGQNETTKKELQLDLSNRDWFVFNDNYGTTEEKYLVRYIDEMISDLQKKYDEVYLLRNEKHFKLYSFDDGKAFEPDFVLLLNQKRENLEITYQVFIEPKGSQLLDKDKWKQDFLMELKSKHKIDQVWHGKEFIIWGLPFYNYSTANTDFKPEFESLI
ncbi:DEAD/DEAH box helicase family protein [Psychromonas aquatilis]|uniref:DEAD/DEAH box helicase family protein n=1 Tax=Psychromonas aquatilis TaxID=2005072 RepID=A0ABU9GL89_9GAMM